MDFLFNKDRPKRSDPNSKQSQLSCWGNLYGCSFYLFSLSLRPYSCLVKVFSESALYMMSTVGHLGDIFSTKVMPCLKRLCYTSTPAWPCLHLLNKNTYLLISEAKRDSIFSDPNVKCGAF